METEKSCNRCGTVKPLDAYYMDRGRSDGRRNTCISCDKARKASPDVREQSKRYYHSSKGKAAERRYAESGKKYETAKVRRAIPEIAEQIKERSRVYSLAWYHRHKHDPAYRETHSGPAWNVARRTYMERYRLTHAIQYRAYHLARYHGLGGKRRYQSDDYKTWRSLYIRQSAVQEKLRPLRVLCRHKRRALQRGLASTFRIRDWQTALEWFEHRCAYCERSGESLTQDHVVPVALGGPYTAQNIVPACKSCNCAKRSSTLDAWATPEARLKICRYFQALI